MSLFRTALFAVHAKAYWEAGLPAIPLHWQEKRPILNSWQTYGERFPTTDEMVQWLDRFPWGNIGLPLGPCSGVVAIDIDTPDANLQKLITDLCPPSPWHRVGAKGAVMAFRFNGEKTFR